MAKLFYSYQDGNVYWIGGGCELKTLMEEHAGGDGLLIYASKTVFELVEYLDYEVSGFTTKVTPNMNRSKPMNDVLFETLDKSVNSFLNEYQKLKATSW